MTTPSWESIGEGGKFSFRVDEVNDVKPWGAHLIPRTGIDVMLRHDETGEVKTFFMAAGQGRSIHSHMRSLTDDLLMSWFEKRKPKKKEKKQA